MTRLIVTFLALGAIAAFGQSTDSLKVAAKKTTKYVPPKTPWGEPDLQGMWPVNHLLGVAYQRNAQYGDRLFMTDDEFQKAKGSVAGRNQRMGAKTIPGEDMASTTLRQTSLISDPKNGQFPALTEYGKKLAGEMRDSYKPGQTVFDSVSDFGPWDRCITRGLPVSMLTRNYNNGRRIVQAPGYVTIILEMAHEARVIPTTPVPKLDADIKQWLGEPRGHWEGDTLVVESLNFNGLVGKSSPGVPGSPRGVHPSTPNMKVTEWFTRVSPTEIDYKIKVEDPEVLVPGSFTVQYPMVLDNSYEMYEYDCHEGNTAVRNYIETSRFERAHANSPKP